MRRMLMAVALLAVGACVSSKSSSSSPAGAPASAVGSSSPKGAVEGFLNAAKNQDLQAMSAYWGTETGLAREQMSRDDLEKRLVIMQCSLTHDAWTYTEENGRLVNSGEQDLGVELRQKNLKAKTSVTAVRGPAGRWFVKNVDLKPLNQFCR